MNRIGAIWAEIDKIAERIEEPQAPPVYGHMVSVSQKCALLASIRGENVELAIIAGLLHDIASLHNHDTEPYRVQATSENHAALGADLAMEMLVKVGLTSAEENEIICTAIKNHTDKYSVDSPFDEILKDADILDHGSVCITNRTPVDETKSAFKYINGKPSRPPRWDKICQDLGITNCRPPIN